MIDDTELLRRYVRERSERAFSELVQRQTGLVYSAALRQVGGDTLLAQDVAQGVFIDLARKAEGLTERTELASWLHTSTRFAALNALREKHRRQLREQEAHLMQEIDRASARDADWESVRPVLDSALCDLNEPDRAALLMRYFEGRAFAEMGAQLGVGESSARMRAERALEKLRDVLAQKGITSTAAALGLVLTSHAVAAPPAGLAGALATGALAKSAVVGGGAGTLLKFFKFSSMNKLTSGLAATFSIGTVGLVSFEAGEKVRATAFFVYAVCFGVGLLFTFISAIAAHAFGGHGDAGHDFGGGHDGHAGHGHAQGHAEGGGGANDMPGFAPLSPTTIAAFVTAFGGFGMIFNELAPTRSPWVSAPLAVVGGLGIAALLFWMLSAIFRRTQGSSEGRVGLLTGHLAAVISPISDGGVGEIAYVQGGSRYSAPARAEDGVAIPTGTTVQITRLVGTQFFVAVA